MISNTYVTATLGLLTFLAVFDVDGASAQSPGAIRITAKIEVRLVFPEGVHIRRNPLACLTRTMKRPPRPGIVRRARGVRLFVPLKRTKKNARRFRELVSHCKDAQALSPPPGVLERCSVPSGYSAVRNEAEFRAINNRDGKYFLCNNIALSAPLAPLFNSESFRGVIDGNNKELRGLVIREPSLVSLGLVRVLESGTIKNLRVIAPQIHGKGAVGVVAGLSLGRIENVRVEGGQVTAERQLAGALVGIKFSGTIASAQSSAFVTAAGQTGDDLVGLGSP